MPPLRVHPDNPRWLADREGRARLLVGSHHWDSLLDNGERPQGFDFERYLDRLVDCGHSVVRLWTHEAWTQDLSHSPWARTGPGLARDGRPRFDLERFDEAYFARLRDRVARASARGLHTIVMLWNGWSLRDNGEGNPWPRHPFHRDNNRNGIDGDPGESGNGDAVCSLRVPAITRLQSRYVERVVAAVGHLDAVLWEIANECPGTSVDWQRAMLRHLRACDSEHAASRGQAGHPIGLTATFPGGGNRELVASAADWISPDRHDGWRRGRWLATPPPNDGAKVVLLDTDHLWGIGGDAAWIWRAVLRGHQPLYMDPLDADATREAARRAMGTARAVVEAAGLERLAPRPELAGSGLCLGPAGPDGDALVAWTAGRSLRVDLRGAPWSRAEPGGQGKTGGSQPSLQAEWVHPVSGERTPIGLRAGAWRRLRAPWNGGAVLCVRTGNSATTHPMTTATALP